jgi:hypothetical protein
MVKLYKEKFKIENEKNYWIVIIFWDLNLIVFSNKSNIYIFKLKYFLNLIYLI